MSICIFQKKIKYTDRHKSIPQLPFVRLHSLTTSKENVDKFVTQGTKSEVILTDFGI